jgi:hypothetical protein
MVTLAHWLVQKWNACNKKRNAATEHLEKSTHSAAIFQVLWKDQVQVQTCPLASATSNLAEKAIKTILYLIDYQKSVARDHSTEQEDHRRG